MDDAKPTRIVFATSPTEWPERRELARFALEPDGTVTAEYADETLRDEHECSGVCSAAGRVFPRDGRRFFDALAVCYSRSSFVWVETRPAARTRYDAGGGTPMGDCTPTPDQETENINHAEFVQAVKEGNSALLRDETRPGGRFQVGARIMGGDVIIGTWHDPKNDGNWHECSGAILHRGFIPQIEALLKKHGYKPDGTK